MHAYVYGPMILTDGFSERAHSEGFFHQQGSSCLTSNAMQAPLPLTSWWD